VGAAVQLINEQYKDKYFFTAAASGGGVENVRRMIGGEFDTTWAHTNIMQEASTGTGLFDGQKPFKDMRVMVFMGDQAVYDALKVTQEPKNREMLTKVMSLWGESGPFFAPVAKMGIPLHPGAIRYWQEKGVKLAPEMLK
jgi:TRAP-type uncharacterized transport system substrate-binding protein